MILKSKAIKDNVLNPQFGKNANPDTLIQGLPLTSFDIEWSHLKPNSKYLHFLMIDYDAIDVCGKPWIHWCVANLDTSKYHGLEENASLTNSKLVQATTSLKFDKGYEDFPFTNTYVGPMPPDRDHTYSLLVWTTEEPLFLNNEFYVSEFYKEIRKATIVEHVEANFIYRK